MFQHKKCNYKTENSLHNFLILRASLKSEGGKNADIQLGDIWWF
jgi:hypothetical protein